MGGENPEATTEPKREIFKRLKIASSAVYETETDAEPQSAGKRKYTLPVRRKARTAPKSKKNAGTAFPAATGGRQFPNESDDHQGSEVLLRKQTLPKRQPISAGAESIWLSLLRMQAKILGPEHPLTYQAKSDLARSRANGHCKGIEDLTTLRRSRDLAIETLGNVHPWVAAFSGDLETLETLTGSAVTIMKSEADQKRPEIDKVPSRADKVSHELRCLSDGHKPTEFSGAGPTKQLSNITGAFSNDSKPVVPRIVTELAPGENHIPTPEGSVQHTADLDSLWNSSLPPHAAPSMTALPVLALGALVNVALNSILWLQRNYGPEQPVKSGKVRVRWTCSCGEKLYDDFTELKLGAARRLEADLKRPRTLTGGAGTPISPNSSNGNLSFMSSSFGGAASSQTSWSSHNFTGVGSMGSNGDAKSSQTLTGVSVEPRS